MPATTSMVDCRGGATCKSSTTFTADAHANHPRLPVGYLLCTTGGLMPALAHPRPTRCIAARWKDRGRRVTWDLRSSAHAQTAGLLTATRRRGRRWGAPRLLHSQSEAQAPRGLPPPGGGGRQCHRTHATEGTCPLRMKDHIKEGQPGMY